MQQLRAALAVPAVVSMCLLAAVSLQGQSREHQMLVSVLDQDGTPVGGLLPSDFSIDEDGNARESFASVPPGPGGKLHC